MDIQELVKKRVNHRSKYGKGTIESICEIKNENPMLNVIFDSGETMRFVFPDSVVHGKYLEIEDSVLAAELEACLCEECGEINNNSKITDGKMLCSKCRNKYLLKQKQEEEKIRSEKESEIWKIIDKKIEYHAKHRYAASKNYNDLKLSEEEKEICKEIEAYKDNNKTAFDKFTIELENVIRDRIKETNYANIALVAIPSSEAYKWSEDPWYA